jgi:hypothetical protein
MVLPGSMDAACSRPNQRSGSYAGLPTLPTPPRQFFSSLRGSRCTRSFQAQAHRRCQVGDSICRQPRLLLPFAMHFWAWPIRVVESTTSSCPATVGRSVQLEAAVRSDAGLKKSSQEIDSSHRALVQVGMTPVGKLSSAARPLHLAPLSQMAF